MGSIFFGNVTDPSSIDLTIFGFIGAIVFTVLFGIWQTTENRRSQNRLILMARHYELRTALINLGYIFSGGDTRIQQNEALREKFVKELERYGINVEKNPEVEFIQDKIKQHPVFSGTFLHHCTKCHEITKPIEVLVNDSKYQNPNHSYDTLKFEVSFKP
ncbi:MAG: hypothetical protein K8Q89_09595 [Nitrosarchaeum sp.]|nr:hypothetical protein [Nitrosarchaeum sp.]